MQMMCTSISRFADKLFFGTSLDFFSAPGGEEVCTTSKRPLCLTWLSHVGLDCLNLISFCVTVQMEPR